MKKAAAGQLFLIPTVLGDSDPSWVIPASVIKKTLELRIFASENVRTSRRYLKKLNPHHNIDEITFFEINHEGNTEILNEILQKCLAGFDVGIISEAGCPGIADPGSLLCSIAHKNDIKVTPLTGPSSILLALIASGSSGQKFTFNGYLSRTIPELEKQLKTLERLANEGTTQIFMETPYRNDKLLQICCSVLTPNTELALCCDITTENERIIRKPISKWRNHQISLHKIPCIFLICTS